MTEQQYKSTYRAYAAQCEERLEQLCNACFQPGSRIGEAARYSLLGGGKRVRGVLTLAACALAGAPAETALEDACALEMVHCYSLIHDDLPCMDDDDLRRGRASCHKRYDEATALLAGDALLTAAFEVAAAAKNAAPHSRAAAVQALARAAGGRGMLYGQELDKKYETCPADGEQILELHRCKTGAMILAAAELGCVDAGLAWPEDPLCAMLDQYARALGLGFQIVDDLLDVTASTETLGKPAGSDAASGKTTFVTLYGLAKTKEMARQTTEQALAALQPLQGNDNADFLRCMARELLQRKN